MLQTQIVAITLLFHDFCTLFIFILVPPEKPRVYTVDNNKEIRLKLGPYRVGETVRVR